MKVSPREIERLTGRAAYNAAVESARVEDYLALVRFAQGDCHWSPTEIVIGLDVEAFHDHLAPDSRLLSNGNLRPYLSPSMRREMVPGAVRALLGAEHTAQSLMALGYVIVGFPSEKSTFDPDGYLRYRAWEREIAEGTFEPDIESSIREYDARLANFTALDPARQALFEELVARSASRSVRVRTFITPLHPLVLEHLDRSRNDERLRGDLVAYLTTLRERWPGFSYVDFTEIATFGGDPELFFDGAHLRDENAVRLVRALFAEAAPGALP